MVHINNVTNKFSLAQTQYLQLKEKKDGACTWFECIDTKLYV